MAASLASVLTSGVAAGSVTSAEAAGVAAGSVLLSGAGVSSGSSGVSEGAAGPEDRNLIRATGPMLAVTSGVAGGLGSVGAPDASGSDPFSIKLFSDNGDMPDDSETSSPVNLLSLSGRMELSLMA